MRMTISVPDDLADQVRARNLPISSICQDALRAAVEQDKKKEQIMTDIQAVAERLRGTIDEERQRHKEEGRELGILWAKEYADVTELKAVAEDTWHGLRGFGTADQSISEFYENVEHRFDAEYADEHNEGFFYGAREVWEAVEPLL